MTQGEADALTTRTIAEYTLFMETGWTPKDIDGLPADQVGLYIALAERAQRKRAERTQGLQARR